MPTCLLSTELATFTLGTCEIHSSCHDFRSGLADSPRLLPGAFELPTNTITVWKVRCCALDNVRGVWSR